MADRCEAGADAGAVWFAQFEETLHQFFADEIIGDFAVEFGFEPAYEAARFGALYGVGAEQVDLGIDLFEIFADDLAIGEGGAVGFDEHGDVARGIEGKEFGPAFPDLFDLQIEIEFFLGQYNSYLPRERMQPEMK
jgi:hypothetical protein